MIIKFIQSTVTLLCQSQDTAVMNREKMLKRCRGRNPPIGEDSGRNYHYAKDFIVIQSI
jgi:hypothetical protein